MTLADSIGLARETAAAALNEALGTLPAEGFSEQQLRNIWLEKLQKAKFLHPEGWYTPPPHGFSVLIGKAADHFARTNQSSLRLPNTWPKDDIRYAKNDILSLYASPVRRADALMGDFGLALYCGDDPDMTAHSLNVLETTLALAAYVQPGMRFKDIYAYAMTRFAREGFQNGITSISDRAGTNIGHTIPLSFEHDPAGRQIQAAGNFMELSEALRTGRKFLSAEEGFVIPEHCAFTIEPRLSKPALPILWFHVIVVFEKGQKTLCHGYDSLFRRYELTAHSNAIAAFRP